MFDKKQSNQTTANKLALTQLLLTSLISLGLWGFSDGKSAYSACLGGVICAMATWLMARIMFDKRNVSASQMLTAFYLAEAAKVLLTVFCFIAAFVLLDLNAYAFILTYIAMLVLQWLALLTIKN